VAARSPRCQFDYLTPSLSGGSWCSVPAYLSRLLHAALCTRKCSPSPIVFRIVASAINGFLASDSGGIFSRRSARARAAVPCKSSNQY